MGILIMGAGSFAREVQDILESLRWAVSGFVVDRKAPGSIGGFPVYHVSDPYLKPCQVVCGIASMDRRGVLNLASALTEREFSFLTAFHPEASVSAYSYYPNEAVGALVNRGVCISRNVKLGLCAVVNRGAMVGHDCILRDGALIGPGANLAGGVEVGVGAIIGMGANVREGVRIGHWATVGMGSVVLEDVPDGETWWGNPARKQR